MIGEDNINLLLASTGFIKVIEKKNPNASYSKWQEDYEKAAEDSKTRS
jgi:hypothetical protein